MELSVVIPAHNSHAGRLARTLASLRGQTLPSNRWETVLVDNASAPALDAAAFTSSAPSNLRLIPEPTLGLTSARRCGIRASLGQVVVLVDDDNVLAPDYLEEALRLFTAAPAIGALGGRSLPEFESPLPADLAEFLGLLACRDLGNAPQTAALHFNPLSGRVVYPHCAPIGAGMALRRTAVQTWIEASSKGAPTDRQGSELSSGGDNDIVLSVLEAGWSVGYFPTLSITHLIPAARTRVAYLARLNRGISKSWMQVLTRHRANPWPPISSSTVALRKAKAWFTHRAWTGPAAYIRWQGACGHFEGRENSANK